MLLVVRKVQSHLLSPCFWPYFLLRTFGRQCRTLRGTPRLLVEVRLPPVSSPQIMSVFVVVGPGGYVAAIKAAQLGLKVLCFRLSVFGLYLIQF